MPIPTKQQQAKHLKMDIYFDCTLNIYSLPKIPESGLYQSFNSILYLFSCFPVLLLMILLYSIVPGEALGQQVLFDEIQ